MLKLLSLPFKTLRSVPIGSFNSQTILITGSNTGIGLETARHILLAGAAKVILGVRSVSKGEKAKVDLEKSYQIHGHGKGMGVIEVWPLDLENYGSVIAFAEKAKGLDRLDGAIMNAGLASAHWVIGPEGWERTLQVNVLSTTLLSLLLLPILLKTRKNFPESKPHLVVVSSGLYAKAKFVERNEKNILEALNERETWEAGQKEGGVGERYNVTKLIEMHVVREMAGLCPSVPVKGEAEGEPAVIINAVTPSFTKTSLMSREPGAPMMLLVMQNLVARTPEEGSKAVVDAALRGVESHGKFLEHQQIMPFADIVSLGEGQTIQRKVWGEITGVMEKVSPDLLKNAFVTM